MPLLIPWPRMWSPVVVSPWWWGGQGCTCVPWSMGPQEPLVQPLRAGLAWIGCWRGRPGKPGTLIASPHPASVTCTASNTKLRGACDHSWCWIIFHAVQLYVSWNPTLSELYFCCLSHKLLCVQSRTTEGPGPRIRCIPPTQWLVPSEESTGNMHPLWKASSPVMAVARLLLLDHLLSSHTQ